MQEKLFDAETLMFLEQIRLKAFYREYAEALTDEVRKEWLPKLQAIHTRLNSGSDAMRDEGYKVWLICNAITSALNSVDYLMKDEPNL